MTDHIRDAGKMVPEALRLADVLEGSALRIDHDAAAELRRLHAENERLAAEVANRNRRALAGDEAVSALANVHAYYEGLEAQRDALLEALKDATKTIEHLGYPLAAIERARAAIKAVEEGK